MARGNRKLINDWRPSLVGVLLALLVWAYWNALSEAAIAWRGEQYSHGVFMPLAAAVLLWLRRLGGRADWWPSQPGEPTRLAVVGGLLALAVASYFSASRLADTTELARGIMVSGLLFLASFLYALALILLSVFSAKTWLEIKGRGKESQPLPQEKETRWSVLQSRGVTEDRAIFVDWPAGMRLTQVWPGLLLLVTATGIRLVFAYLGLDVLATPTLALSCLGVFSIVLGIRAIGWSWPAAVVLLFSFPLPFSVERGVLVPMQGLAAKGGTFLLQTLGLEATNDGAHFIRLGDIQLGVVEQCSGLRMATVFLALVVLYVLIADVPRWQKPVLLLSAVPMAILVNILRITVTGVLYVYAGPEWGQRVFHDWAGFAMPLVAVFLLFGLRAFLNWLIVFEPEAEIPLPQRMPPKSSGI